MRIFLGAPATFSVDPNFTIMFNLPNFLTLINLFLGCCALLCVFTGQFPEAAMLLFGSLVVDFLDGMAARAMKICSPMGKELDSLADMVSFGVAPGAIVYMLLVKAGSGDYVLPEGIDLKALPGFIITLFSCLRLAKFNLDKRQSEHFIGLATPSCTIFLVGLMLMNYYDAYGLGEWVIQPVFLYAIIALMSYLLISEIPMFSFKIKSFQWEGNEIKIIFALTSVVLLILFRETALSMSILLYILLNLIVFLFFPKTAEKQNMVG